MQLLESAFKKETVGLVTREQFVEKVRLFHTFLLLVDFELVQQLNLRHADVSRIILSFLSVSISLRFDLLRFS